MSIESVAATFQAFAERIEALEKDLADARALLKRSRNPLHPSWQWLSEETDAFLARTEP